MKISSLGPNEIPQRRSGEVVGTPALRGEEIFAQRGGTAASHSSTRAFTEALVIAHTAKSIVSRAMEIAFQLQGLATRTLTGGSVDQAEIAQVVSAANAVMSESERGPASAVLIPQINGALRERRIIDFASVQESLASLKTQARHMQEGGLPDIAQINEAFESLKGTQESIESIHREFQTASAALPHVTIEEAENARTPVERVIASMSSERGVALTAQGNIHPERVRELLG